MPSSTSNLAAASPAHAQEAAAWLARIAGSRDKAAFVQLFEAYAPRIKAYLRRQGLEGALAEDLTQEVMLQIWNRAGQFDGARARASTWIFTIARNRLIDHWRKHRHEALAPAVGDAAEEAVYVPPDTAEARQTEEHLHAALASLSPEQRAVVDDSFFHDRPHPMIAQARAIPLGTVKSRLRLALEHLRRALREPAPKSASATPPTTARETKP